MPKIPEYPAASSVQGSDLLVLEQASGTRKVTVDQVNDLPNTLLGEIEANTEDSLASLTDAQRLTSDPDFKPFKVAFGVAQIGTAVNAVVRRGTAADGFVYDQIITTTQVGNGTPTAVTAYRNESGTVVSAPTGFVAGNVPHGASTSITASVADAALLGTSPSGNVISGAAAGARLTQVTITSNVTSGQVIMSFTTKKNATAQTYPVLTASGTVTATMPRLSEGDAFDTVSFYRVGSTVGTLSAFFNGFIQP